MFRLATAVAAVAFAAAVPSLSYAQTSSPNVLRVCTGSQTGNYHWSFQQIRSRIGDDVFQQIVEVPTSGSLENLRKMTKGDCDMGFSQADVVGQYLIENPGSRDNLSVFKVLYEEYVQILCPVASGWNSLSDIAVAKGQRRMIVGENGSGTAETWRIIVGVNDKKYGAIERDNQPADITSANTVLDSKNTCMLWVSGLNSNDMRSANELSVRTPNGKPGLRLIAIDDAALTKIKGPNGDPLYKMRTIHPHPASHGTPALYDHLINNGGFFSSASIDVLTVPANLMIRNDFREAMGRQRSARIMRAIGDALPTIWNRVSPARE